jgi:hypothetical protein
MQLRVQIVTTNATQMQLHLQMQLQMQLRLPLGGNFFRANLFSRKICTLGGNFFRANLFSRKSVHVCRFFRAILFTQTDLRGNRVARKPEWFAQTDLRVQMQLH